MSYCPGENCSKRDSCAKHIKGNGQLIDWSRYGWHAAGFDRDGNYKSEGEIYCGDNGTYGYQCYENSLGFHYLEECVSCPHRGLCFQYLEWAGDITRAGRPIFGGCADITADPEKARKKLEDRLIEYRKRMERNMGGSTTHAEGSK